MHRPHWSQAERQTDPPCLKTMRRLERNLRRRRLWDGSAINHPRVGDVLVHYGPSLGPHKTIQIGPFGSMRRNTQSDAHDV